MRLFLIFLLLTFYTLPPGTRYRVTAVESTVKNGDSLCISERAAGMGLSRLTKPPETIVLIKSKPVTPQAVNSTALSAAAWLP